MLYRKLDTGHADDVAFNPLKRYSLAMAVFDDSGADHSKATKPMVLKFGRWIIYAIMEDSYYVMQSSIVLIVILYAWIQVFIWALLSKNGFRENWLIHFLLALSCRTKLCGWYFRLTVPHMTGKVMSVSKYQWYRSVLHRSFLNPLFTVQKGTLRP